MSDRKLVAFIPRDVPTTESNHVVMYRTSDGTTLIFRIPTSDGARDLRHYLNECADIEVRP